MIATRYPWHAWLRPGNTFAVKRGIDFRGRTDSFVNTLRQRASQRRLGLKVDVTSDGKVVTVVVLQSPRRRRVDLFTEN